MQVAYGPASHCLSLFLNVFFFFAVAHTHMYMRPAVWVLCPLECFGFLCKSSSSLALDLFIELAVAAAIVCPSTSTWNRKKKYCYAEDRPHNTQYTIHTGWIRWITNSELHGSHYRTLNCLPTALWYGKIFNKWKQKNFQYKPTMEKLLDGNGTAYSLAVTTIRCCHSLFVRTHRSAVVPRITVNNISQAHV